MKKSLSISFVLIFYCSIVFAQSNLNSYKYILVPKQFEFQNSEDKYQINSLTKFLFNRAGYTVLFMDDEYPEDLASNGCLALKVKLNNNPSMFKTKMNMDLFDCKNRLIFSTKEAVSKEKEFKKAFHEAIRLTFLELEELNYKYNPSDASANKKEMEVSKVVVTPKKVLAPKIKQETVVKEVVIEKLNTDMPKVENTKVTKTTKIKPLKIEKKQIAKTIEGKFNFDNWGTSTISKKGDNYTVIGGDENFEFATIYKTSKPTIFIIKRVAYKQPQLLELNSEGNLKVDTKKGTKIYERVH
ncbi:hypothetical protein [Lutibacter sp.]